jgi:hypothetical protein
MNLNLISYYNPITNLFYQYPAFASDVEIGDFKAMREEDFAKKKKKMDKHITAIVDDVKLISLNA